MYCLFGRGFESLQLHKNLHKLNIYGGFIFFSLINILIRYKVFNRPSRLFLSYFCWRVFLPLCFVDE